MASDSGDEGSDADLAESVSDSGDSLASVHSLYRSSPFRMYLKYYDYASAWVDSRFSAAPRASYEGIISEATPGTIYIVQLLRDFPALGENFRWFTDADFLYRLIDQGLKPRPGPLNTKILPHVGRLDSLGITESSPKADSSVTWYQGVFCVPKKAAGSLRFIMSCRAINSALDMTSLPRCHLPSYSEILATVFGASLVMQFDFKSFFFQFGLPMDVRPYFAFRACRLHRRMTRLPMGYAPAPQAAQALTSALIQKSCTGTNAQGLAWIDNAIFCGDSVSLARVHQAFKQLCEKYNVVIGDYEAPAAYTTLLGIEVDLRQRRWRMDPTWVMKTLPAAQNLLSTGQGTLRTWWRICGAFLWRYHALRLPLHGALTILTWMSQTSRLHLPWDAPYVMGDRVCRALQLQADALARNDWQSWVVRERLVVQVVCDASLSGWAVVQEDLRPLYGAFWGELAAATIFLKELFAAYKAVSTICSRPRWRGYHIILFSDNQAVIGAIRKGVSHVEGAQRWLNDIQYCLERHDCSLEPEYVRTCENIADQYTRL